MTLNRYAKVVLGAWIALWAAVFILRAFKVL